MKYPILASVGTLDLPVNIKHMDNKLDGIVELIFVRGGISAKSNKPYLQLSNGRAEFFAKIDKSFVVTDDTFSAFSEDDQVNVRCSVLVGSEGVNVLEVSKDE